MMNILKRLFELWKRFGKFLAKIITWVILSIFYFLVIGAFSLFIRLILRKDLLNKKFIDSPTFWSDREEEKINLENCRQQF